MPVARIFANLLLLLACGLFIADSRATSHDRGEAEPTTDAVDKAAIKNATLLAPVVVSGTVAGPGLWRADRGEQTLWILGHLQPLPRGIKWDAEDVKATLDEVGALIEMPYARIRANAGFWGRLALAPRVIGLRNDPQGRMLKERLPPDVYARWESLRKRYLGRGHKAEKWRLLFAAEHLLDAAKRKSRLSGDSKVRKAIERWAKKRKVERVESATEFLIDDPKAMLTEFRETPIDDLACFKTTLAWIEHDIDLMRARANAWADGDIRRLRELSTRRPESACVGSLLDNDLFRNRGIDDLGGQIRQTWLRVVDETLERQGSALALLPMSSLLGEDNYLDELASRGFNITSPE
ncbi:MAG: TraB/GumN family protein [Xanthomonadales bacterium]|nr:TraB/GumN family protein [Xanthomonadales bacterium]